MFKIQQLTTEFSFQSHFMDIDGVKIHYLDEGAGDPVVFLHGMPTWSYLWRNVIPTVAQHNRCIAPDLVGMGLSDKPNIDYTVFDHIHYITKFLDQLDLHNLTLVMHGWGSVIGFHYAMQHQDRIKGLVFSEAQIRPLRQWSDLSLPLQHFFSLIQDEEHANKEIIENNYLVETMLPTGTIRAISDEEMNYYRKPFLTPESRKPLLQYVRDFPKGNNKPEDVLALIRDYSEQLEKSPIPKLMFYAIPGFITTVDDLSWAKAHLLNLELIDLGEALHFVPESVPLLFANELVEWYQRL
jgi:haloalkane dehalogenase